MTARYEPLRDFCGAMAFCLPPATTCDATQACLVVEACLIPEYERCGRGRRGPPVALEPIAMSMPPLYAVPLSDRNTTLSFRTTARSKPSPGVTNPSVGCSTSPCGLSSLSACAYSDLMCTSHRLRRSDQALHPVAQRRGKVRSCAFRKATR